MVEELERIHVFSEERTQFYAAELTLALEFLHRYGILHRSATLCPLYAFVIEMISVLFTFNTEDNV